MAALASAGAASYIAVRYPLLVDLILLRPADGVVAGTVLFVLLLEALRRAVGKALPLIVLTFVLYGVLADLMPGRLEGRASDWRQLIAYLSIDVNGMLGIPIKIGTTIVVTFILFGSLLTVTGGSRFFTELALLGMGRFRGGSAKIAVAASALFGSISGSAVANVVATGVVTIPMIKKSGYAPHQAGAIEAVASTGGQLMPPVMGAAAFLMADYLQVPYAEVMLAAMIPAFLWYATLFIQVDLESAKLGILGTPRAELPSLGKVMREGGHFLLPFVVLVGGLLWLNWEPEYAALCGTAVLIVLVLVVPHKGKRMTVREVTSAVVSSGGAVVDIIAITAIAGILIGAMN
ncbi:MAG: TRAP transporter permease, partial [Burkholderiales bacterium]